MDSQSKPEVEAQESESVQNPGRRQAIKAGAGAAALLVTLTSRPAFASTAYSSGTMKEGPNELMDEERYMAQRDQKQSSSRS